MIAISRITCMTKPAKNVLESKGSEGLNESNIESVTSVKFCGTNEGFDFREGKFNRIEIRGVGRQEEKLAASRFNEGVGVVRFVNLIIVNNHYLTRTKGRK
jgi:hypothetical protein